MCYHIYSAVEKMRFYMPKENPKSLIAHLRSKQGYMTPKEVAELLHCDRETVYKNIKRGLPAERIHGRWKIDPHLLADWIERGSSLS